jgi:hypothetical protein
MFNLQFDPVTTEMVIGKKKKSTTVVIGDGSSATISALIVPAPLELMVNNLTVIDFVEITDTGAFSIYTDSSVEVT